MDVHLFNITFLDRLGSADFSDSPAFQRLAPGESRIPVISFQIACQESSANSSAPDPQDSTFAQPDFTDASGSLATRLVSRWRAGSQGGKRVGLKPPGQRAFGVSRR